MKLKIQSRVAQVDRTWVQIQDTQTVQPIAQFAMQLIDRWGMIAGAPDGEDSAGRAKGRLLEPEEVVARACRTAQITFEQFAHKDWLLDVPLPPTEEERKAYSQPKIGNQ